MYIIIIYKYYIIILYYITRNILFLSKYFKEIEHFLIVIFQLCFQVWSQFPKICIMFKLKSLKWLNLQGRDFLKVERETLLKILSVYLCWNLFPLTWEYNDTVNQQNLPAVIFSGDALARHIIIISSLAISGDRLYHSQWYAVSATSVLWEIVNLSTCFSLLINN